MIGQLVAIDMKEETITLKIENFSLARFKAFQEYELINKGQGKDLLSAVVAMNRNAQLGGCEKAYRDNFNFAYKFLKGEPL